MRLAVELDHAPRLLGAAIDAVRAGNRLDQRVGLHDLVHVEDIEEDRVEARQQLVDDDDEVEALIRKELRMKGVVNSNKNIISMMDSTEGSSVNIPVIIPLLSVKIAIPSFLSEISLITSVKLSFSFVKEK